jgi:ankyrin repeat protein
MAGTAPPLSNRETDYKFGYASLVVTGSQSVIPLPGAPSVPEHLAVLELLVSRGLPASLPDIAGYTALHHSVSGTPHVNPEIIRKLIVSGADLNYRNRWGSTPLHDAIANDHIAGINLLMEHGASVDLPDGNGLSVRLAYMHPWERLSPPQ